MRKSILALAIILMLAACTGGTNEEPAKEAAPAAQTETAVDEDAVIALMGLGFTRGECVKALKAARAAGAETAEQLISYALKHIK